MPKPPGSPPWIRLRRPGDDVDHTRYRLGPWTPSASHPGSRLGGAQCLSDDARAGGPRRGTARSDAGIYVRRGATGCGEPVEGFGSLDCQADAPLLLGPARGETRSSSGASRRTTRPIPLAPHGRPPMSGRRLRGRKSGGRARCQFKRRPGNRSSRHTCRGAERSRKKHRSDGAAAPRLLLEVWLLPKCQLK